jgi:hypothetical protein
MQRPVTTVCPRAIVSVPVLESGSRLKRIDKSMFQYSRVSFGSVSKEFTRNKKTPRLGTRLFVGD